jgi:hypothetical protein
LNPELGPLPAITAPVWIDGFTQGGTFDGSSSTLGIGINGDGITGNGLTADANGVWFSGLAVYNFHGNGIVFDFPGSADGSWGSDWDTESYGIAGPSAIVGLVLACNIGTDLSGSGGTSNTGTGVVVEGAGTTEGITAVVENSIITGNGGSGVSDADYATDVSYCTITNNGASGIVETGNQASLVENTITGNGASGIVDSGGTANEPSTGAFLYSNSIEYNSAYGIDETGYYSAITGDTIANNPLDGILQSGTGATISSSTIEYNGENGIQDSGTGLTMNDNTIKYNTDHGIREEGVNATASGNTVSSNGENPQATALFSNPGNQYNYDRDSVTVDLSTSDSLTFSASGLPSGLSINSTTGAITGTLGNEDYAYSPYHVTVTGYDSGADVSASQTYLWNALDVLRAFSISYDVPTNTTLKVSEGVGLLNFYESLEDLTPTITDVSAAEYGTRTANMVGDSYDGSFTYVPPTGFSGEDNFTYTITGAGETQTATVTINVGTSGSGESPTPDFATNGTLEYDFSTPGSPGYTDTFTLNSVPYVLNTSTAWDVQYQLMAAPLPSVTDVATIALPVNEPVLDTSQLNGFSFTQGRQLIGYIVQVRQDLDQVTSDISAAVSAGYAGSPMQGQINKWFQGNGVGAAYAAPTSDQVQSILDAYTEVESLLDDTDDPIIYNNSQNDPTYSAYYGYNTGSEVLICARFYGSTATSADQFATVIHELTHFEPVGPYGAGTDDYGYYAAGSLSAADVTWDNIDGVSGLVTVTTANLIDNADSYAGFLTQYYPN